MENNMDSLEDLKLKINKFFRINYSIGAYIGKYDIKPSKTINYSILFGTLFLIILSILLCDILGTKYSIFSAHSTYFMNRTSLLSILFAISIFNIFNSKRNYSNRCINILSSCVLGVYLISDNELVRNVLWTEIFKVNKFVSSSYLLLHILLCLFLTFSICIIIEFIRKCTIGVIISKVFDFFEPYVKKMICCFKKCCDKIEENYEKNKE